MTGFGQWNVDKSNIFHMQAWLLKHPELSLISSPLLSHLPRSKMAEILGLYHRRYHRAERASKVLPDSYQVYTEQEINHFCFELLKLWSCFLEQLALIMLTNIIFQSYTRILFNFLSLFLMRFVDNLLYCNSCNFLLIIITVKRNCYKSLQN